MNKTVLTLMAAAVCCLSASALDYKTTVKGLPDDATVYLRNHSSRENLDSANVSGGVVTFSGVVEQPVIADVMIGPRKQAAMLILDSTPAEIQLGADNASTLVKGSDLNKKLFSTRDAVDAPFRAAMNAFQQKAKEVEEKYGQQIPDSILQPLQAEYEKIYNDRNEAIKKAVVDNKDNLVAAVYIPSCLNMDGGVDFVKDFLKTYPYADSPSLESARKYLAALERKQPGTMFTDFTMNDMDGKPHKLSEYVGKGNYVLVDFWASWCGPCRKEMPNVKAAYEKYHPKGFEIVGVSFDNNADAWKKGSEALGVIWPQMSDLKGWGSLAGEIYGVRSIPATLLFDPEGKVVSNSLRGEALIEKLAEIYE